MYANVRFLRFIAAMPTNLACNPAQFSNLLAKILV